MEVPFGASNSKKTHVWFDAFSLLTVMRVEMRQLSILELKQR